MLPVCAVSWWSRGPLDEIEQRAPIEREFA